MNYEIIGWTLFLLVCVVLGCAMVAELVGCFDPPGEPVRPQCSGVLKVSGDYTECSCGTAWDTNDLYPPAGHANRPSREGMVVGVDANMRVLTEWVACDSADVHGMLNFKCIAEGRVLMIVNQYGYGHSMQHSVGVDERTTLRVWVPTARPIHG